MPKKTPPQVDRAFRGIWIPSEIWLAQDLNAGEKALIGEIDSLDRGDGCFASNTHLAKFVGVTPGRLANVITGLRKKGYIEDAGFDGRRRYIRVVQSVRGARREDLPLPAPEEKPKVPAVIETKTDGAVLNDIIELFQGINPSFKTFYKNKTERAALDRLVVEIGEKKVRDIVGYLPKSNASRYAPTITKPSELERDLGRLIAWAQKQKDKAPASSGSKGLRTA